MSASKHVNKYLFGELFEQMHGITIDDALSGNKVKMVGIHNERDPGSQWFTPEEHDEVMEKPWSEIHSKLTAPTDPEATVRKYQLVNPVQHFIAGGSLYENAAQLRDLTPFLRNASRANEVPLYRGANRPPAVDSGRDRPLGFTPDRYAAVSYTKDRWDGRGRGQIFKASAGTVKGVPLREIGGNQMYVNKKTKRRDYEWLVLPETIPQEWPDK